MINVFTFIQYGKDKRYAEEGKWRTPEKFLILLAALGGSIGAFAGMKKFKHKIRKNKFRIGIPCILVLQIILILSLIYFLKI